MSNGAPGMREENEALARALAAERDRVSRMRSTLSWRLTAPLRALRRAAERLLGRRLGRSSPPPRPRTDPWEQRGLYWDSEYNSGAWLREHAGLLPPGTIPARTLTLRFLLMPESPELPSSRGIPRLRMEAGPVSAEIRPDAPGEHALTLHPEAACLDPQRPVVLHLEGLALHNALAWLGRVSAPFPLPGPLRRRLAEHRRQHANRRVRLLGFDADGVPLVSLLNPDLRLLEAATGATEPARREEPPSAPTSLPTGLNIHGFFQARFGIGESARCMARAALGAGVPCDLVQLRLPTGAKVGDKSFADRLVEHGRHSVNVFHLDAPQSEEIDHHHPGARAGRRNIAYWAWELTEFPDNWVRHARFFDEIWCPSEFVRAALAPKLRQPVIAMPHAIDVAKPAQPVDRLRADLGLPQDRFLFLFVWDLASTSARKNPQAVVEAFRIAFDTGRSDVGLVLKTHNVDRHPEAFDALRASVSGIDGVTVISRTLDREKVTALQTACDCFVSLHRSEGFGLSVAEAMALGKPVISTDWSATREFVTHETGCPVTARLVTLEETYGPYPKGHQWAEADTAMAAAWMRRLASHPSEAEAIGTRAAGHIRDNFSPAVIGRLYQNRLNSMRLW